MKKPAQRKAVAKKSRSQSEPKVGSSTSRYHGVDRNVFTPNPYFNFAREYRKTRTATSAVCGAEWKKMSKEQKQIYKKDAYETKFLGGPSTYDNSKPVILIRFNPGLKRQL